MNWYKNIVTVYKDYENIKSRKYHYVFVGRYINEPVSPISNSSEANNKGKNKIIYCFLKNHMTKALCGTNQYGYKMHWCRANGKKYTIQIWMAFRAIQKNTLSFAIYICMHELPKIFQV